MHPSTTANNKYTAPAQQPTLSSSADPHDLTLVALLMRTSRSMTLPSRPAGIHVPPADHDMVIATIESVLDLIDGNEEEEEEEQQPKATWPASSLRGARRQWLFVKPEKVALLVLVQVLQLGAPKIVSNCW
jgi:hypothetical protein